MDNKTTQLTRAQRDQERLEAEIESKAGVEDILRDIQREMEQRLEQLSNINKNILARLNSVERYYLQSLKTEREGEERSEEDQCGGNTSRVMLDNIDQQDPGDLGEDKIFMIESSPKETLSSREGCALESAARNSGLHVVMVRVGELLDLRDNTTCQLYTRSVSQ